MHLSDRLSIAVINLEPMLTSNLQNKIDEPARVAVQDFKNARIESQIRTFSELREQIHNDLRLQHPEWIEPSGESPMCDFYETRLMELLGAHA